MATTQPDGHPPKQNFAQKVETVRDGYHASYVGIQSTIGILCTFILAGIILSAFFPKGTIIGDIVRLAWDIVASVFDLFFGVAEHTAPEKTIVVDPATKEVQHNDKTIIVFAIGFFLLLAYLKGRASVLHSFWGMLSQNPQDHH